MRRANPLLATKGAELLLTFFAGRYLLHFCRLR